MYFPTADITVNPVFPFLVALSISFFTSMGGVSGAFLLLPYQMSILGYTNPSVSATNQFYNIIACPAGIYRYAREGRLLWPLAGTLILGTLPGVFLGAYIRIAFLQDPSKFRIFAGLFILYIALRMAYGFWQGKKDAKGVVGMERVSVLENTKRTLRFSFQGSEYKVSKASLFLLSFVVGVLGGTYGVGGGAILSPFLIAFYGLPVYVVAGSTLLATAATSVAGVVCYSGLSFVYTSVTTAPDWRLGLCIGFGGMVGMYLGARCQKYVPARAIKVLLFSCMIVIAVRYLFF